MSNVLIKRETFSSIATALRSLGALSSYIPVSAFPSAIRVQQEQLYKYNNNSFIASINAMPGGQSVLTDSTYGVIHTVKSYAFKNNSSLLGVSLSSCSQVYTHAFANCSNLATVTAPCLTYIGEYAFFNCTSLAHIDMGSVSYIGSNAFYRCITLPSIDLTYVTSMSDYAFQMCTALKYVYAPNLTRIGFNRGAFQSCSNLSFVYMPKMSTLRLDEFGYCYSLHTIYIGDLVPHDDYGYFEFPRVGLSGLKSVYMMFPFVPNAYIDSYTWPKPFFTSVNGEYASIFVKPSMYSAFITDPNFSVISARISTFSGSFADLGLI